MRFFHSVLLATLLTGCQYDRSYLNLNSDSGSPFLGLQLSVDASDSQHASAKNTVQLASSESTVPVSAIATETTRAQSPRWVRTPAALSNLGRFPDAQLSVEVTEHPLTTVGRRLAAF